MQRIQMQKLRTTKKNINKQVVKIIISIDTETYDFDEKEGEFTPVLNSRKFVLGCAIVNNEKEYYFTTHTAMAKWLKKQIEDSPHKVYIYGHNI